MKVNFAFVFLIFAVFIVRAVRSESNIILTIVDKFESAVKVNPRFTVPCDPDFAHEAERCIYLIKRPKVELADNNLESK